VATASASKPVTDAQVQTALDGRYVRQAQINTANGVAPLDPSGKVPAANLPASTSPVTSVAGRTGAVALAAGDISGLAAAAAAAAPVQSVAGKVGGVTLVAADVGGLTAAITNALAALGVPITVVESGGVYPNRPAYTGPVRWKGIDQPANGGTTAGGTAKAVANLDEWYRLS
jgi:hemolysin activation/secretion protein